MGDPLPQNVPPGHYYSPMPSSSDVERAIGRAARAGRSLPGIDLREADQLRLLDDLAALYADLPFRAEPTHHRYHYDNDWFMFSDGVFLALVMRWAHPARLVEVGAGWSTALALDVDELFLGGATRITVIEPDPERLRSLLRPGDLDGCVLESPVQDVPLPVFESLAAGDVLAIDSSHVLKAGSDVQHLLDEVLPRLAPGVLVHVHDVLYPFEYPASWLRSGTALNEAYAIRALLQHSRGYEVLLWNSFLEHAHRDRLAADFPLALSGSHVTGGIWLRRIAG